MSTTHRRLHEILDHKARTLLECGQPEEAVRVARKALDLAERGYGPGDRHVILTIQKLGDIYAEMEDWPDARVEYERALRIASQVLPNDYQLITKLQVRLANLCERMGQRKFAIHFYEQALKTLEGSDALATAFAAQISASIADYYRGINDMPKAERAYQTAVRAFEQMDMSSFRNKEIKAQILSQYAEFAGARQNFPVAEKMHLEALNLRKDIYGASHLEIGRSSARLASIYYSLGEFQEAELHFGQAVATLEDFLPQSAEDYENIAGSYAEVLRRVGKRKEAGVVNRRLQEVQKMRRKLEKQRRKAQKKQIDELITSGGEFPGVGAP